MNEPPGLSNAAAILQYVSSRPTHALQARDIIEEIEHWQRLLEAQRQAEIQKAANPLAKVEQATIRWGGLGVAVVGIPACWAALPVGLTLAIAGLGITCYGEFKQYRDRQRQQRFEEPIQLAIKRREALIDELKQRAAK